MKEPIFLKNARFSLTMDRGRILENKSIRMQDGRIAEIGNIKKQRGDEVIDCSSSLVMPGLVNAHTHVAMVLLRGLNDDAPLQEWLESMWKKEKKLTPDLQFDGALMGLMEMLRTGTTACLDMYSDFDSARAAKELGIRLGAGTPLISVFGPGDERLAKASDFIDRYKGDDLIVPVVNLHAIYTNDEDTMRKAGELSREKDVILHAHCSETRKEVFDNRREKGRLALEELDEHRVVWERTVLAHMGWAASWEFDIVKERGASLVHCPTSNQKLATGGFFPFKDLKEKDITVGLGTDGAASNNSLDMFREMRSMALLQKGQYWDPLACTSDDALECATINGSRILGLEGGMIREGMNADLCILDIDPHIMPLRKENLSSALVYSAVGDLVNTTVVGGKVVYRNGRLRDGTSLKERYMEISEKCSEALGI
ncbi:MAG: amidohydrolase [Thermoplasmatota archaeon]